METVLELARHLGPDGEVVLRRRCVDDGEPVDELIVDGTFAMDSAETSTERRLAELVGPGAEHGRVLVGGLGLGYTAAELLTSGVGRLDVVERQECLVQWARGGLTPTLGRVAADPRVRLHVADVAEALAGQLPEAPGPWDAVVLDVDNGPDWLIHPGNAGLYTEAGLRAAYAQVKPGGTLAVWCQGVAPALLATLSQIDPSAREHRYPVTRGRRLLSYAVYTTGSTAAHRPT